MELTLYQAQAVCLHTTGPCTALALQAYSRAVSYGTVSNVLCDWTWHHRLPNYLCQWFCQRVYQCFSVRQQLCERECLRQCSRVGEVIHEKRGARCHTLSACRSGLGMHYQRTVQQLGCR